MDRLIETLAGLGIPGAILILTIEIASKGIKGAPAITHALRVIGPNGMKTGIAVLIATGLASMAASEIGIEQVSIAVVKKVIQNEGYTKEEMVEKVKTYKVSKSLKRKIVGYVYMT